MRALRTAKGARAAARSTRLRRGRRPAARRLPCKELTHARGASKCGLTPCVAAAAAGAKQ